jgi:hypothetical protein
VGRGGGDGSEPWRGFSFCLRRGGRARSFFRLCPSPPLLLSQERNAKGRFHPIGRPTSLIFFGPSAIISYRYGQQRRVVPTDERDWILSLCSLVFQLVSQPARCKRRVGRSMLVAVKRRCCRVTCSLAIEITLFLFILCHQLMSPFLVLYGSHFCSIPRG